jgi:cell shape-determining protein MreC
MLSASTYQPLTDQDNHRQAQVKNHIANLQAQIDSQMAENARLRSFLREHPLLNATFVYAEILQNTPTELTIDCGSSKGIDTGQFVLGDNCIIGTISQVWTTSAKVSLVNSPQSRIAVKIADIDAIIQGDRNNIIKAPLLSKKLYNIKTGQQVFCQPKSGFLTTPIIIGTVSECKTDPANPLLWDITVAPSCDIKSLTSIDVIVFNKNQTEQ